MASTTIEEKVQKLITQAIEDLGYELYDVEYLKEGKDYHLCIYIDKDDGIDISDCEKVNEVINPILDKADYIKDQYFLEVSSTGLEKNLRKKEHYLKQIGNEIEVRLYSKIDNKKVIQGILKEYNDEFLILQTHQDEIKIKLAQIASAKTLYDWNTQN